MSVTTTECEQCHALLPVPKTEDLRRCRKMATPGELFCIYHKGWNGPVWDEDQEAAGGVTSTATQNSDRVLQLLEAISKRQLAQERDNKLWKEEIEGLVNVLMIREEETFKLITKFIEVAKSLKK